ncbi:MAG: MAPEG family protein [Quisquiliibacterium sp.]
MNTGIYAGLCGVLLVVLYLRISQRRLATKIVLGSDGDADLERRIRAHGNFIETAPFALLLLYLFEQAGTGAIYIHAVGTLLVISRIAHAQGISKTAGRSVGRFYGSIGTVLVIGGLSIALLARGLF